MAVYTKEYESQPEAILTNVIICPAVDLSANVAVPVHCQVENVLWDTGATNTLISQEVVNALGLQPKNKALISSAGGDVESWTYLVHVILPTGTAELNVQALLNDNSVWSSFRCVLVHMTCMWKLLPLPEGPRQKKLELSVILFLPSLPLMSMATGTPCLSV